MTEHSKRKQLARDLRAEVSGPKRHRGRPSNAELAAEYAKARRLAVGEVLARHGYLSPEDAQKAAEDYWQATPFTARFGVLPDFGPEPDVSDAEPGRILRDT